VTQLRSTETTTDTSGDVSPTRTDATPTQEPSREAGDQVAEAGDRIAEPQPDDQAAEPGEAERLSTADIARGAADSRRRPPEPVGPGRTTEVAESTVAPLFSEDASTELHDRWTDVQAGFVDEPRAAVEQADALVAEVMKRLAESFATERQALEQQWSSGGDASTEDLRMALRRYRSFFDRLLSI
jgi:hypothetical protein